MEREHRGSRETKIQKLATALRNGEVMTPLRAWSRWRMAHNTYHRTIWELRHTKGMAIQRRIVAENGVRYSMHWLDISSSPTTLKEGVPNG